MKYIISNTDRRMQKNFLLQFIRFVLMGLSFAKLTKHD